MAELLEILGDTADTKKSSGGFSSMKLVVPGKVTESGELMTAELMSLMCPEPGPSNRWVFGPDSEGEFGHVLSPGTCWRVQEIIID